MSEEYRRVLRELASLRLSGQLAPLRETVTDTAETLAKTDYVCRPCVERIRRAIHDATAGQRHVR